MSKCIAMIAQKLLVKRLVILIHDSKLFQSDENKDRLSVNSLHKDRFSANSLQKRSVINLCQKRIK